MLTLTGVIQPNLGQQSHQVSAVQPGFLSYQTLPEVSLHLPGSKENPAGIGPCRTGLGCRLSLAALMHIWIKKSE